jgi:hypothetical protein
VPLNQRIEALAHLTCNSFGIAGTHLATINERVAFAASDIEGRDLSRFRPELFDKSDDRERVALLAFQLEPGLDAT